MFDSKFSGVEIKQILLIILCVLTFIFSWLLLSLRNMESKANRILSAYMSVMFFIYLLKSFEEFQQHELSVITYLFAIPLSLCSSPIIFLYIQKLTSVKFRISKITLIHFIPALILLLVNIFTFGMIPYDDKVLLIGGVIKNPEIVPLLHIYVKAYFISQYLYDIQAVLYSILMLRILVRHKNRISDIFSYKENISLGWLQIFVVVFLIVSITEILLYAYTGYIATGGSDARGMSTALIDHFDIFSFVLTILYCFFIGFFGLRQTDIYHVPKKIIIPATINNIHEPTQKPEEPRVNQEIAIGIEEISGPTNDEDEHKKKYNKFELPETQKEKILKDIHLAMETKKLFLNSRLTLIDLSLEIHTNKNYVSSIINEKMQKNFFQFVNEYRINEAKNLLTNKTFDNHSIEGIALTVGFNSKSAFNPAFKKQTGLTPSVFRKKHNA